MARTRNKSLVDAVDTPTVCRVTGVPSSTLHAWVRDGLVAPSYRPPTGRRATCWWAYQDVVAVRALKALRQAGCPMQTIKKVKGLLDRESDGFGNRVLWWTGSDIEVVDSMGEVQSALRRPGQLVFLHFLAIQLGDWHKEVVEKSASDVRKIDAEHLRSLAEKRKARLKDQLRA